MLGEERLWAQSVVLLYRVQHFATGHAVPRHHVCLPRWVSSTQQATHHGCRDNESSADGVPEDDDPIAEAALFEQLEIQAHAVREEPLATTDHYGADDHLELIDQTGSYRLRGEVRTIDRQVAAGAGLEPPDRVGVELPLDPGARTARLRERLRVDDFLGPLPLPRPLQLDW